MSNYDRVYNFSAGPSVLPLEVLEKVQKELLNYDGSGQSVMEMSHRSKEYQRIIDEAEANLRELMHIPDNYTRNFCPSAVTALPPSRATYLTILFAPRPFCSTPLSSRLRTFS